jgi:predicted secreted hydrolase
MKTSCTSAVAALFSILFVLPPESAQFRAALPGYHYVFPRDYFSHPAFQTEWWYYTGNLRTVDGRKFGFELTFFREGVTRDPAANSTWGVRDLYLAHFAISDLDGNKFLHTERINRSGPGIAGADWSQQRVWNGNWSVAWANGAENLNAIADQFAISLSLQPQKPLVIHGENGVSQKSAGEGRASHYFSETRLRTSGSLEIDSKKYQVTGLAWMDHEFFTQQLAPDLAGWDWLSLQLDDNTELMLFHIRRKDGTIDPYSAGTFVDAQGHSRRLKANDFQLEPTGETQPGRAWTSPVTRATYPIRWKISVPSLGITLEASTPLPSQEFTSDSKFVPSYWEGAIFLTGIKNTEPLHGSGYLEMTGYDRSVTIPSRARLL